MLRPSNLIECFEIGRGDSHSRVSPAADPESSSRLSGRGPRSLGEVWREVSVTAMTNLRQSRTHTMQGASSYDGFEKIQDVSESRRILRRRFVFGFASCCEAWLCRAVCER